MTREEVVERMWAARRDLYHLALRQLRNDADAADAVQGAILKCLQGLDRGIDIRDPEAFLARAVHWQVSTIIRERQEARQRLRPLEDARWLAAQTPDIVAELIRADLVQTGMEELRERDREILERTYLEEQRPDVIRFEMGLSASAVKHRRSRARRRFDDGLRGVA